MTNERGEGARLAMIEAAERLIAEHGVAGVSLREIGTQAGQRNTAAARYHFGTKEALVDAVFRHRMEPINAHRLLLVDAMDRDGEGRDPRRLIEAYVYPLADTLGSHHHPTWYLRFCLKAGYVPGTAPTDLGRQSWTRGMHVVHERIMALLADAGMPPALRRDRWSFVGGFVGQALAERERRLEEGRPRNLTDRQVFLSHLCDTAVALLTAPLSPATLSHMGDAVVTS